MNEKIAVKLIQLYTDFRRSRGWKKDPKFPLFIDMIFEFTRRYKVYIDVVSNYAQNGPFSLNEFKEHVINFDPDLEKKRFFQKNHYICFEVPDRKTLEMLIDQGGDYLMFQFRICDGNVRPISKSHQQQLEEYKAEINEGLFDDHRTIAVIKDNWDCLGLRIMFSDAIEEKYKSLLLDISNLKND